MAPSNRIQQWHLTMAPRPSNSIPPWHGTQQWHDSQKGRHHGPPFLEVRTLKALAIWENIWKIDQCEGFVNHCYFVTIGWLLLHGYPCSTKAQLVPRWDVKSLAQSPLRLGGIWISNEINHINSNYINCEALPCLVKNTKTNLVPSDTILQRNQQNLYPSSKSVYPNPFLQIFHEKQGRVSSSNHQRCHAYRSGWDRCRTPPAG